MKEEKKVDKTLEEMNQKIDLLLSQEDNKKVKHKKVGKSQQKKGYVNFIYLRENNVIEDAKIPIENLTTVYDDVIRTATPEKVFNWKGTPTIIQPSWRRDPFSSKEDYEEAVKENMVAIKDRLLIARLESGDIKSKKKMSGGMIFAIIAAVAVAGYLLFA